MNRTVFALIPMLLSIIACGPSPFQIDPIEPPDPEVCGQTTEVTLQILDRCDQSPVILDRLTLTYPDGTVLDFQPALDDPPGAYRLSDVALCQEHRISASAEGYKNYVDVPVTFFEPFVSATATPLNGCGQ